MSRATTRPTRRTRATAVALLGAVALLAVPACSDDEETTSSATTEGTASTGGTTATAAAPDLDALEADLQAAVEATVEEQGMPGAVVLVTTPDGSWETAVGVTDLETEEAMATGLRWPLRSVTKSFTVTLVLQLVDEGVLTLDDPVSDWVPDVPNGDQITLRQLADMTSGLGDYTSQAFIEDFVADPTREFTLDELIAYGVAEPTQGEPGADHVYTNLNTLLLGKVVEEATGQPFEQVLSERILEPVGMADTVYPTSVDQWTTDAVGYQPDDEVGLEPQPVNYSVFGPAGAMITTLSDLALWGPALATGSLLEPGTQAERIVGAPLEVGPPYDQYALGIGEVDGWWGHTGEGFGFTALVMHQAETGTTVVVATNVSALDVHASQAVFEAMLPVLQGS